MKPKEENWSLSSASCLQKPPPPKLRPNADYIELYVGHRYLDYEFVHGYGGGESPKQIAPHKRQSTSFQSILDSFSRAASFSSSSEPKFSF